MAPSRTGGTLGTVGSGGAASPRDICRTGSLLHGPVRQTCLASLRDACRTGRGAPAGVSGEDDTAAGTRYNGPREVRVEQGFPLRSFGCESYLCFESEATVELRPLTLVFGRNNTGKSAIVRLSRLILAALHTPSTYGVPLRVDDVSYGDRFRDLVHGRDFFGSARFTCTLVDQGDSLHVDARIRNVSSDSFSDDALVERWSTRGAIDRDAALSDGDDGVRRLGVDLEGLLPSNEPSFGRWRKLAAELSRTTSHLGPVRKLLAAGYQVSPSARLGLDGGGAPAQLAASIDLSERVGDWFAEHLGGWRLETTRTGDTFHLELARGETRVNACRAGQGIHQLVPVIVQQLALQATASPGQPRLAIVEQPELHLHDAAHAPIGDLIVESARRRAATLLVETHSEALFLRVRRRVADGTLDPADLAVYFVGSRDLQAPHGVHRVDVKPDGDLGWWPEGVFLERYAEVRELQRAQRR